jgi:hypothetical protein
LPDSGTLLTVYGSSLAIAGIGFAVAIAIVAWAFREG